MRLRSLILMFLAVLGPPAANADWIILKNGSVIETKGVWHATATHVAYFDPKTGKPNVIPAGFVDLAKSREATKTGKPPAPPAREKVAITDEDVFNWDADVLRALHSGDIAGALNATAEERRAMYCAVVYVDEQARALCQMGRAVPDYFPKTEMTPERQKVLHGLDQLDRAIDCFRAHRSESGRNRCLDRIKQENP